MTASEDAPLFRVVETDQFTNWDEYKTGPLTAEAAGEDAEMRRSVTVGRYRFDVVPVEPWMTDPAAVRERHRDRHGSWRMEDCGNRDCRDMRIRLLNENLDKRFAAVDAEESGDG